MVIIIISTNGNTVDNIIDIDKLLFLFWFISQGYEIPKKLRNIITKVPNNNIIFPSSYLLKLNIDVSKSYRDTIDAKNDIKIVSIVICINNSNNYFLFHFLFLFLVDHLFQPK